MAENDEFMRRAIELARMGMNANSGGPFGAVITLDGRIIGEGGNCVTSTNDPTAHAEVVAIRDACKTVGTFELTNAVIYASCEPCPMCLGAIYWARIGRIYIAADREDAKAAGFDDSMIYDEVSAPRDDREIPMSQVLQDEGIKLFKEWVAKEDKIEY